MAVPRVTHLDRRTLDALREIVRRELSAIQGGQGPVASQRLQHDDIALATGALTAGSTTAPGSGTASFLRYASGAYSTDATGAIYNPSTDALPANKIYLACRDRLSGEWFAAFSPSGTTDPVAWAVAQSNWTKGGGDPYVTVLRCRSRTVSATTGASFSCYLPRAGTKRDPNIVSGAIMPYMADPDGDALCVGNYLDDAIRSVKNFVGPTTDIPIGWALMDGTANSTGNGGSGIAMAVGSDRYFPRAALTSAEVGASSGANTAIVPAHASSDVAACLQNHACSDIAPHTGFGTDTAGGHTHPGSSVNDATVVIASHSTGITDIGYANPEDSGHNHAIYTATMADGGGEGYPQGPFVGNQNTEDGVANLHDNGHEHTFGALQHASTPHGHSLTIASDGAHSHSSTDLPHSGSLAHAGSTSTLAHASIGTVPEFRYLLFIERLDNSV